MKARFDGSLLLIAGAAALTCLIPSCGGNSPVKPTPGTTLPSPTTPPPGSSSCSLGPGSVSASCFSNSPQLSHYVETAIDLLIREKPSLVDRTSSKPPNTDQYRVLDEQKFLDTVVDNLRRQQVCAERDADALDFMRVVVKDSNAFSETYDVLDNGYMRRRQSAYVTTCTPAAFPIDRNSADVPPAGSGCGRPYPPPVSRFHCKVALRANAYYTGDATPYVGPDLDYCNALGFVGQTICPVRREGWPDRVPCENWRVGRAKDTGRYGPTWTNDKGELCTGTATNCINSPDNQYQVRVFKSGKMHASAENGAECFLTVER
jgi:hypothetical protein